MNDVPLVNGNDINSINTSIIAIKKQLKQLNEWVGLIDTPDINIDLTPFVKKTDVVNTVQSGNMNPVTSNAVSEIMSTRSLILQKTITTTDANYSLDGNFNLNDFTSIELIASDTNYMRGGMPISMGLFKSGRGVTMPCYYGGNLVSIIMSYVSDTQLKLRSTNANVVDILIYGYKTNVPSQRNSRGIENNTDSNNRKGEEENKDDEPIEEPKEEEKK